MDSSGLNLQASASPFGVFVYGSESIRIRIFAARLLERMSSEGITYTPISRTAIHRRIGTHNANANANANMRSSSQDSDGDEVVTQDISHPWDPPQSKSSQSTSRRLQLAIVFVTSLEDL